MKDTLQYKGYLGSVEFSLEDELLFGKILHVKDLISYGGETVEELKETFHDAVDDYLVMCEEMGIEPRKPFKGSFNVRTQPEQHEAIAYQAAIEGITLNQLVCKAVDHYLKKDDGPQLHRHIHEHITYSYNRDIQASIVMEESPSEQLFTISKSKTDKSTPYLN